MRLYRPHIPINVRCRVAMRQLGELWIDDALEAHAGVLGAFLARLLKKLAGLLGEEKLHLDHDPALENRERHGEGKNTRYTPPANDPEFLIYRTQQDHKIKTLVRGDGAQLSDAAIARKRKRKERKATRRKTQWPKRPLRSASRWPKRKMR